MMTELIKVIGDMGLGLGSLTLIAYLFVTSSIRQDKKDAAYIETLVLVKNSMIKLQGDVDKNWELTQSIAKTLADTTRVMEGCKFHKEMAK